MFCDACDTVMQREILIRFRRVCGLTTRVTHSCWYCWSCQADRYVSQLPQPLWTRLTKRTRRMISNPIRAIVQAVRSHYGRQARVVLSATTRGAEREYPNRWPPLRARPEERLLGECWGA